MNKLAWTLIALTIWIDLCLIIGVICTGTYGRIKAAAVIQLPGYSVDSTTSGGALMIMFVALWTAALAVVGLWALSRTSRENLGARS